MLTSDTFVSINLPDASLRPAFEICLKMCTNRFRYENNSDFNPNLLTLVYSVFFLI